MIEEKNSAGMILAIRIPATANDEPPDSVVTSGIEESDDEPVAGPTHELATHIAWKSRCCARSRR